MVSEWETVLLGDQVELLTGFPFKSKQYTEDSDGIKLVRGDNVVQGHLRWDGVKRWPVELLNGLENYLLATGDVVLAMDRPWIEAGLKYSELTSHDLPALLVQRVSRLRGKKHLQTRFLKYLIGSPYFTNHVLAVQTGTAVPHISGSQIKEFVFKLPPLPEQKSIAHILGSLDDKIELNRRMNATLEGMAQALFKSWFVDFDPVIDNALEAGNPIPEELSKRAEVRRKALADGTANREAAKQFPDAFQLIKKIGWIPVGWKMKLAESIVIRKKVCQKFTKNNVLTSGDIPVFDQGSGLLLGFHNGLADIESSKMNPSFIFGDHTCITHLSPKPFSVGPNVIPLGAKDFDPYWTYFAIKDIQVFQEYRRHWMEFKIKKVLVPSEKLASYFGNFVCDLYVSIESNKDKSTSLVNLRDTLLPKLISGDLRIPEAGNLIEEALA